MKDIISRSDIEFLVDTFYNKIKQDAVVGFFFTEITTINFDTHLPKMYDFWESVIFKKGTYNGNPMLSHILLHQKVKLQIAHFERWLFLWEETLTNNYLGENTQEALQRAKQIASLIQFKLSQV